jgi:aminocarboxymuconate-semialdehyde decarboxylase
LPRGGRASGERAHVRGFITGSEICGIDLDDDRLDPLWEALEASACILMIHPGMASLTSGRHVFGLTTGVSFPLETTVAAARLLLASVPSGWPRVKFFLAHGGGALPYLLGRLDHVWGEEGRSGPRPSEIARRFYAASILHSPGAQAFAAQAFGHGRVLWGSDHPFSLPGGDDDIPGKDIEDAVRSFLGT